MVDLVGRQDTVFVVDNGMVVEEGKQDTVSVVDKQDIVFVVDMMEHDINLFYRLEDMYS